MNDIWTQSCLISPSLICCDMLHLESQVRQLEQAGVPMLHVDLIDGHFSPSMPLGLEAVRQLRAVTDLPFDVHLMATNQDYFIEELLNIGVEQIVFHAEHESHLDYRLNMLHDHGVRAGIALKPATPLSALDFVLEKCDTVLLMLINPGYAGSASERQVPYAERKIRQLRERINACGLSTAIEIDGRISKENIAAYGVGDVNIFVAGSTCLDRRNLRASAEDLLRFCSEIRK